MATCTGCDYKFLTPNTLKTDRAGAESYLAEKFGMHECGQGGSSFGRRRDMALECPSGDKTRARVDTLSGTMLASRKLISLAWDRCSSFG